MNQDSGLPKDKSQNTYIGMLIQTLFTTPAIIPWWRRYINLTIKKILCTVPIFVFSWNFSDVLILSHKPYFCDCFFQIKTKKYFCWFCFSIFYLNLAGPINCLWSGYGEWSRCSVSCGTGTQQRKRMILQKAKNGGLECRGDPIETRSCSQPRCPGTLCFSRIFTMYEFFGM